MDNLMTNKDVIRDKLASNKSILLLPHYKIHYNLHSRGEKLGNYFIKNIVKTNRVKVFHRLNLFNLRD